MKQVLFCPLVDRSRLTIFLIISCIASLVIDVCEIVAFAKEKLRVVPYFILQLVKATLWLVMFVFTVVLLGIYINYTVRSDENPSLSALGWTSIALLAVIW